MILNLVKNPPDTTNQISRSQDIDCLDVAIDETRNFQTRNFYDLSMFALVKSQSSLILFALLTITSESLCLIIFV